VVVLTPLAVGKVELVGVAVVPFAKGGCEEAEEVISTEEVVFVKINVFVVVDTTIELDVGGCSTIVSVVVDASLLELVTVTTGVKIEVTVVVLWGAELVELARTTLVCRITVSVVVPWGVGLVVFAGTVVGCSVTVTVSSGTEVVMFAG